LAMPAVQRFGRGAQIDAFQGDKWIRTEERCCDDNSH